MTAGQSFSVAEVSLLPFSSKQVALWGPLRGVETIETSVHFP